MGYDGWFLLIAEVDKENKLWLYVDGNKWYGESYGVHLARRKMFTLENFLNHF